MKKISVQLMFAIMICSIATAILLCGVSIQRSTSVIKDETEKTLTLASEKYANQFSAIFKNTEGMVDAIASNVSVTFDPSEFSSDEEYFQQYKAYLDDIIKETATNGETAHGLYFTFNPELTKEEKEVWYAHNKKGELVSIDADFRANKRSFKQPVQKEMLYYFKPIWEKEGAWTGPYLDPDVSLNMLSYSKAVYVNGTLIGVAGADILTEDTIDIVETMKIYEGSYAFLLDEDYNVMIHPNFSQDTNLKTVQGGKLSFIVTHMKNEKTGVVQFVDENQNSILAFSHLSNGWILGISQPTNEVYSPIRLLSLVMAGLALVAILLTVVFAVVFSNKFSKPILSAADQLKLLEMGDYTHQIPDELLDRKDDLGEFAKAISAIQLAMKQEASDNREKDVLLIYQSKQAKIGEMVGNISHQWKQPLNNINLILLNLYDAYLYHELDEDYLKQTIEKTSKIVKTMSTTIEDFTDFLKPNREKMEFDVSNSIHLALSLMEASIQYNHISVSLDVEENLLLYGFPNEFSHVLFNVLNNARDATLEANGDERKIHIWGCAQQETIVLEITNKGNPIPEELLPMVFDPYFTTKGEKDGTGIGLYISKLIIEQRMGGQIELLNQQGGVCCKISVERRR